MLTSKIVKNRICVAKSSKRGYAVIKCTDLKYTVLSVSMLYTILLLNKIRSNNNSFYDTSY